jgi:hypothetical protein
MVRRAHHFALAVALLFLAREGAAQVLYQPTPPPVVTAENTTWFASGEPIEWNGDIYYLAGAAQGFNGYQMVRSGSYRGIPLYIDSTIEPYSLVFVPLTGGRMQPYERRRTGILAGTTGSRAPSLPTQVATEMIGMNGVAQAPAPPTFAPSYEVVSAPFTAPEPTGMTGRVPSTAPAITSPSPAAAPPEPAPVGTSGRTEVTPPRPVTTVIPPTGANTIWINFDGRRWYAAGKAIEYDASALEEIGTYDGWVVYRRKGDASVIYVPSVPGMLSPYKRR